MENYMNISERVMALTTEEKITARDYIELAYAGNKFALLALSGLFGMHVTIGVAYDIDTAIVSSLSEHTLNVEENRLNQRMGLHNIVPLSPDRVINRIAAQRMMAGLTQTELANKIGSTQKDISRWENGIHTPSATWIKKISDALNCKMDDLFN